MDYETNQIYLEDLICLNELKKKSRFKKTTFQGMKRKGPVGTLKDNEETDSNNVKTLLEQGLQPHRILAVTSMDNLDLLICYVVQYKDGRKELVPNKIAHQHCPQLVIEFLESRLIFSEHNDELNDDKFEELTLDHENDLKHDDEQDQDDDIYMFDELSKYLNIDHLTNIVQVDKPDILIDYSENSSQIHKMIDRSDISEIECDDDNDNHRNIIQIDVDHDAPQEKQLDSLIGLFDRKIDDEEDILLIGQVPEPDIENQEKNNVEKSRELNELNYTLSLSQGPSDNNQNQPKETSESPPDILDELINSRNEVGPSSENDDEKESSFLSNLSLIPETQFSFEI